MPHIYVLKLAILIKPLYLKYITWLLFLGFTTLCSAQEYLVSGQVINAQTQAGVPFANIKFKGSTAGLGTDSAGNFRFMTRANSVKLSISSIGYKSKEITIQAASYNNLAIVLEPLHINLDDIVVRPGENPAWPILRATLKNRPLHKPDNYDTYQAQLYTKIKINIADLLKIKPKKDSINRVEPPLIFEYAANTFYKKPNQKKEVVFAANTNFLKTYASMLLWLPMDLHVYHFYNEIYNFYPQKRLYVNPLNDQTFKQYEWELLDTLQSDADHYLLNFTPNKGSNFNGFKGQIQIHKKDFAMTHILAETEDSLQQLKIKIEHHYQKTPQGWFPKTVSTSLDLYTQLDTLKGKVKAEFYSVFDSVQINHVIAKNTFDGLAMEFIRGAENVPDSIFNLYRKKPLEGLEKGKLSFKQDRISRGIIAIDKKYTTQVQNLLAGVIDLKKAEILLFNSLDINRINLLSTGFTLSNKYIDKPRFGIRLSPNFGIRDRKFKFRSEFNWFITKDRYNRLAVGYNSIYHNSINADDYMGPNFMYPFYFQTLPQIKSDFNFMKINEQKGVFAHLHLKPAAHTLLKLEYQRNTNTPYNANILGDSMAYSEKEISAQVRFAYKEKINRIGLFETAINRYYPIINFKVTKGLPQNGYEYWRIYLNQTYQIRYKRLGTTDFQPRLTYQNGRFNSDFLVESENKDRIIYKDPGMLLSYLKAENSNITLTQLNFSINHDFNNSLLKPKTPYFQPRIKVFHTFNYSWLGININNYTQKINSQSIGLQVRNLLRIPIKGFWVGLGTQVSYFYGPNAPTNTRERLRVTLKMF